MADIFSSSGFADDPAADFLAREQDQFASINGGGGDGDDDFGFGGQSTEPAAASQG